MVRDEHYEMFGYGCHEGNYAMTNSLKGGTGEGALASR
jgi:hypothetical protein